MAGAFAEGGDDFFCALESTLESALESTALESALESVGFFFRVSALLEALLLRDELPDELDRLEPEELDPELELLELLLPEDELQEDVSN